VKEALVDTGILSFYFKGDAKVVQQFGEYLKEFDQINISIITYYEILGGLKFKQAENQIRDFEEFINNNTIFHVSEESAKISSEIYADLGKKELQLAPLIF
jgi:tRNA(fMet)-specific endonuclease VapC